MCEIFDKHTDTTQKAIRLLEERTEILDLLIKAGVPKLLIGLSKGELVVVKKEEAVCPVIGYEFQSPFSESKT